VVRLVDAGLPRILLDADLARDAVDLGALLHERLHAAGATARARHVLDEVDPPSLRELHPARPIAAVLGRRAVPVAHPLRLGGSFVPSSANRAVSTAPSTGYSGSSHGPQRRNTHSCPSPPGFVVARIRTGMPAELRPRESM